MGEPQDEEGETSAGKTGNENWPASVAVAEPSPERRRDELAQRVSAKQCRDHGRRRTEPVGHVGDQRDENAESENVDDADEKQRSQLFVSHQWPGSIFEISEPGRTCGG